MVTDSDVASGLSYGVAFLVVKGATGVTDSVLLGEVTVGKNTAPVSTGGRVGRGEALVCAVLGKPGGMRVVVVGGCLSTVIVFVVLVSVVAAVLGTVVLSVTEDISETGAGLEAVTIGETTGECVVASVVSLVGCTTGRGILMVTSCSMELVVGAMVVVGCSGAAVVVISSSGESEGLVEEVNRVVLDVLGLKGLTAVVRVLVTHEVVAVGRASVTLTVDSGSCTSGLKVGGVVGGEGDFEVLESSGATEEEEVVTGRVDSSGAGGSLEEVVCVLMVGRVVVILVVGPVCGGGVSVEIVVFREGVAAEVTASCIT